MSTNAKSKTTSGEDLLQALKGGGQEPSSQNAAPSQPESQPAVVDPTDGTAAQAGTDSRSGGVVATAPPSSPPPNTPSATPTQAASETSAAPAFVSELAELGFTDVADEQEGQRRLLESYRLAQQQQQQLAEQMQQLAPWVQYGRQYYEQLGDPSFQQYMAQRQTPAAQQPQQPGERPWYMAPQYDAELVARYRQATVGQDGQIAYDWKPNTPPEVRRQYEQYQQHTELVSDRLVRDPYNAIGEIAQAALLPQIQQMLDSYFAERVDRVRQQEQITQTAQGLIESNADWLYERDPRTNRPLETFDPTTGRSSLSFSQEGKRFYGYLQEATNLGIATPEARWQWADMKRRLNQDTPSAVAPPQAATQPAAQSRDARTAEYLKRSAKAAAPTPNRGGATVAAAGEPRGGRRGSAGQDLIEEMRRQGISL